jgi:predicted NBD/HSP70 family sugar kinase
VTSTAGGLIDGTGLAKTLHWQHMTVSTRAILADVLVHGPRPRAELARRLSLSPASLTKLTRPLLEHGLLTAHSSRCQPETGRPSQPLEIVPEWQPVIGIKLNPGDLFAVRTDLRARVLEQYECRLATPDVATVVEAIAGAIDVLDPPGAVGRVGVSLAANIRPGDSVVAESPYLGWSHVPLGVLVATRTGRSVVLANDVRALTAAQHWFGPGRRSRCFGVLTVGKGVGCGLVVNNAIVAGHDGHAGLVSHLPIVEGGPLCRRGHRGCASAYLSSGSIARSLAATHGFGWTSFDDALEAARENSPPAVRVFRDACYALGVVTASIANMIGPDRIVLSGEGIGMYDVAPDAFSEGVARNVHWEASSFELDVEPFAFSEWARGAAVVAIQSLIGKNSAAAA